LRTAFSYWNIAWILVFGISLTGCGTKREKSIDVYKEALTAIAAGDKDKALELLDRSIDLDPTSFAYYQRAQIHLERDDAAAAIAYCEKRPRFEVVSRGVQERARQALQGQERKTAQFQEVAAARSWTAKLASAVNSRSGAGSSPPPRRGECGSWPVICSAHKSGCLGFPRPIGPLSAAWRARCQLRSASQGHRRPH
jgi:hypothetical protein